jgi:hypothetical protein
MRQAIGKSQSQPQITTTVIPTGDQSGRILMSGFSSGMKIAKHRVKVKLGGTTPSGIVYVWGQDGGPLNDGASGEWGVADGESGGGALNNGVAITKSSYFLLSNLSAFQAIWFEVRTITGTNPTFDISVAEIVERAD